VKAAVLVAGSLSTEDWPRPEIGEGELLLRLRGCGLCGSDIAKIAAPPNPRPMVVGHEVVGEVVAAGPGAPFAVGGRVVAAHHVPCGGCHYCRRGSPSMCRAFKASNLDPGGFAEFVRVPAVNVRHATFALPRHAADAIRTGDLISHRVPLARLAEGVALVQRHEALKVYVTP
jgi:L-iditol 2-dehydrogenase